MLRLALTGLGCVAAMAGGVFLFSNSFGQHEPVDVASLDPHAALQTETDKGLLAKAVAILPWVKEDTAPKTRGAALAARAELRRADLNSYFPDAPEGWEKLEWNDFFQGKFDVPDSFENIGTEATVYLKGSKAIYIRVELAEPTGPMVADLLQYQRYVERGGDLSDLEDLRPSVAHTIEAVRSTADGWSISSDMTFKHFAHVKGVSFVSGKPKPVFGQPNKLRYIYGALGGGAVLKIRSDASTDYVLELLEGVDFDSLNHMQSVPHPLVGEGLPAFTIETPEEWLNARGFELKKVKRVIPVKKEESAEEVAEEDETDKEKKKGDGKDDGKGKDYAKADKGH